MQQLFFVIIRAGSLEIQQQTPEDTRGWLLVEKLQEVRGTSKEERAMDIIHLMRDGRKGTGRTGKPFNLNRPSLFFGSGWSEKLSVLYSLEKKYLMF